MRFVPAPMHTTQSRRAKAMIAAKAVRNFFRIALHREKLFCERLVKAGCLRHAS